MLRLGLAEGCAKPSLLIGDNRILITDTPVLHELPQSLRTQRSSRLMGDDRNFHMAWKWTSNYVCYSYDYIYIERERERMKISSFGPDSTMLSHVKPCEIHLKPLLVRSPWLRQATSVPRTRSMRQRMERRRHAMAPSGSSSGGRGLPPGTLLNKLKNEISYPLVI